MPVLTTDTSIFYRYFNSDYEYYDFRLGFEELRSYSTSRVHIGVDLILVTDNKNLIIFIMFMN